MVSGSFPGRSSKVFYSTVDGLFRPHSPQLGRSLGLRESVGFRVYLESQFTIIWGKCCPLFL